MQRGNKVVASGAEEECTSEYEYSVEKYIYPVFAQFLPPN